MWVFSRQSNNYGRSEKQNNVEIVSEREKNGVCCCDGRKKTFQYLLFSRPKKAMQKKKKKGPKTINKEKGLIHAFNKWLYTGLEEKEGKSMSLGRQQP